MRTRLRVLIGVAVFFGAALAGGLLFGTSERPTRLGVDTARPVATSAPSIRAFCAQWTEFFGSRDAAPLTPPALSEDEMYARLAQVAPPEVQADLGTIRGRSRGAPGTDIAAAADRLARYADEVCTAAPDTGAPAVTTTPAT